jgi:hypothetical protein
MRVFEIFFDFVKDKFDCFETVFHSLNKFC